VLCAGHWIATTREDRASSQDEKMFAHRSSFLSGYARRE
jgi:hypothetical protein